MGEDAPSPWAPVHPPAVLGTPAQETPHRGLTCVGYQGKDTKGKRRTKTVCSSFPRASAGAKVNRVSPCRRGPPFPGNGQMGPGPLSLGPSDSLSTFSAVVKLLRQSRPGKPLADEKFLLCLKNTGRPQANGRVYETECVPMHPCLCVIISSPS